MKRLMSLFSGAGAGSGAGSGLATQQGVGQSTYRTLDCRGGIHEACDVCDCGCHPFRP